MRTWSKEGNGDKWVPGKYGARMLAFGAGKKPVEFKNYKTHGKGCKLGTMCVYISQFGQGGIRGSFGTVSTDKEL